MCMCFFLLKLTCTIKVILFHLKGEKLPCFTIRPLTLLSFLFSPAPLYTFSLCPQNPLLDLLTSRSSNLVWAGSCAWCTQQFFPKVCQLPFNTHVFYVVCSEISALFACQKRMKALWNIPPKKSSIKKSQQ